MRKKHSEHPGLETKLEIPLEKKVATTRVSSTEKKCKKHASKITNTPTLPKIPKQLKNPPAKSEITPYVLAVITPDKYFVLHDSRVIKDIEELATLLETMGDELFSYHVNDQRNDFATWIYDVFSEKDLAGNLAATKDKFEMCTHLYRYLLKSAQKRGRK